VVFVSATEESTFITTKVVHNALLADRFPGREAIYPLRP